VPLRDGTALHIILLHTDQWLRKQRTSIGHIFDLNLPSVRYKGQALLTAAEPAACPGVSEGDLKAVFHRDDDADNGILVLGARRQRTRSGFAERCGNLRLVLLELIERRGRLARRANVEMIRSLERLREQEAKVGKLVFLDEEKDGVGGCATVRAVRPCPPRDAWLEKMQVGEFRPWPNRVGDLKIASESEPLAVTPTHPFWSPNRNRWVPAGRLEPGDQVQTQLGPSVVEWYVMRERPEAVVYNIEVEGDHVYRVGESGVLVHNASAPKAGTQPPCPQQCVVDDGVMGPYVALEQAVLSGAEATTIDFGLLFETEQKSRIRDANRARNGNELISDCYPVNGRVPGYCGRWVDEQRVLVTPMSGRFMGARLGQLMKHKWTTSSQNPRTGRTATVTPC
jgi:hypothetical protein